MKKNDDLTLEITSLTGEGQGVGKVEGFAVFVPGALPGETVNAHIIKATSSYAVAKVTQVIRPAANRVAPKCPVYGQCGGCAFQHLDYPGQLAAKQQQVADALIRLGGIPQPPMRPIIGMEHPWHYRNKGSFPFGTQAAAVVFGFYAGRSHRLIPLYDCPIQDERVVEIARKVTSWANDSGLAAYDEQTSQGVLRHVMARALTTGETMAVLVAAKPLRPAQLESLIAALPEVDSLWLNLNERVTNVIFGDAFTLLSGKPTLTETIGDFQYRVSPQSFLQVNAAQTAVLYQSAISLLDPQPQETIVDAYCGIGTISLMLSKKCKKVIGIEQVSQAIQDAKQNAADNGLTNLEFLCGDTEALLPKLFTGGATIDAVLLDPPRKGCEEAALTAIAASNVSRIVYVSCNPATLARDIKILCAKGYGVTALQPVDMFPQTGHVETVVLMEKNK